MTDHDFVTLTAAILLAGGGFLTFVGTLCLSRAKLPSHRKAFDTIQTIGVAGLVVGVVSFLFG